MSGLNPLFTVASIIAVASTAMVITRTVAVHALLYLVVSLLAIAVIFATLGAPFAAALEIIIYAGAIMILFIFVVMMLNLDRGDAARESRWLSPQSWAGPAILAGLMVAELIYGGLRDGGIGQAGLVVGPSAIGRELYGPYILAAELASMLLLAGLVSAYHLGRAIGARQE